MTTAALTRYEIDVTDVEYLRHGDKPLLARVYKPRGTGPFPMVIDLHGGAWCKKDRTSDAGTDEPLAKTGLKAMARENRNTLAQFSREHGQVKTRPAYLPRNMAPLRTSA